MLIPKPLVLFIDAYDSFSNNIISLLETTLDVSVRTVKIDNPILLASDAALRKELSHYVAVVCGPGPGNPKNPEDVGIISRIWRLRDKDILPVLGICLGFQSLCLEFGGEVQRLQGPQHGIIRRVRHIGESQTSPGKSIFHGVGEIHATLYQSLCADIGHDALSQEKWEELKWQRTNKAPLLKPLAWVEHEGSEENNSGIEDARVLVAVQHAQKPFWALQYHPESICTNDESKRLVQNWFYQAGRWNHHSGRKVNISGAILGQSSVPESLLAQAENRMLSDPQPVSMGYSTQLICHYRKTDLPRDMSVPDVVEAIQNMNQDQVILESANAHIQSPGAADVRGRYSIIGLNAAKSLRVEYTTGQDYMTVIFPHDHSGSSVVKYPISHGGIWPFLASKINSEPVVDGPKISPFWGGFMGYTTYELGLEGIGVPPKGGRHCRSRPDLCFVWISQSLVIDHQENVIYMQHVAHRSAKAQLHADMDVMIEKLVNWRHSVVEPSPKSFAPSVSALFLPRNSNYEAKVSACQDEIRSGTSYELCLTGQTHLQLSTPPSAWSIYKSLRKRQPAPFASYMRLGSATFISASPERFVKWDENGECELRPMKGTVRKSPEVSTLAQAIKLLDIPKEKAENLMIVDLVRHDLHGICGSGNVSVPRLMVVEEYASVFQMISIVRGRIPPPFSPEMAAHISESEKRKALQERYTGLDVLAASLPPGSMTGAPKKRSCEILNGIEDQERSLYSGVVGYIDVRGRGDWSVNIRCMFKWDDEDKDVPEDCDFDIEEEKIEKSGETKKIETWHIGAGGAVTALSTPVGEREEMLTKLNGTLGIFRDS